MSSADRNFQYRAEARRKGLCSYCFCRKPPEGFKVCDHCRLLVNARTKLYRAGAKEACLNPKSPRRRMEHESTKWAALDDGKHCPVCELRGDHECTQRVDPWQHSGAGRTYPEGA